MNYKPSTPSQPSNEYELKLTRGMKGQINTQVWKKQSVGA